MRFEKFSGILSGVVLLFLTQTRRSDEKSLRYTSWKWQGCFQRRWLSSGTTCVTRRQFFAVCAPMLEENCRRRRLENFREGWILVRGVWLMYIVAKPWRCSLCEKCLAWKHTSGFLPPSLATSNHAVWWDLDRPKSKHCPRLSRVFLDVDNNDNLIDSARASFQD